MWPFQDEWLFTDAFGTPWRFSLAPMGESLPHLSFEEINQHDIGSIVFFTFSPDSTNDRARSRVLIEIMDRVAGTRLGEELPDPTHDPHGFLSDIRNRMTFELEHAVRYGMLRLERVEDPRFATIDLRLPSPEARAPEPVVEEKTTFVGIRIVDQDGAPVSRVAGLVLSPEDREYRMTSNGDGLIRLDGFSPGTCRVTFPDLDYRDVSSPKPTPSSAHGSDSTAHNVKQGETASSLARQHGFSQFKTVWNANENADLRKARKDPHVLRPGDLVHVPKRTAPEFSLASGKQHTISIHQPKVSVRLTLLDWLGEPRKSESVVVEVEGEKQTVETDHDGKLTFFVAEHVQHATLRCKGEEMRLRIGHLDPGTTLDGVSARLRNLGFYPDGAEDNDHLRFALELFVDHAKESPKGNEALAEKLRTEHGS